METPLRTRNCTGSDRDTWDNCLAGCPEGSIFHSWKWLDLVETVHGATTHRRLILDGDEPIGCFPFFTTERRGIRIAASPLMGWATPTLGPVLRRVDVDVSDLVATELAAAGCDYSEITATDVSSLSRLADHKYKLLDRSTFVVDLGAGEEELWKGLGKSSRRRVRKAEKNGIRVEIVRWPDIEEVYCAMGLATYEKSHRAPPIPTAQFREIDRTLAPEGSVLILAAKHEEEVLAAKIILLFNRSMHWWDGVSSGAMRGLSPHGFLNWESLRWGAANGYVHCDFGGANSPPIAEFKRSFGGQPKPYLYAHRNHSLKVRVIRPLYRPIVGALRNAKWWLSRSK